MAIISRVDYENDGRVDAAPIMEGTKEKSAAAIRWSNCLPDLAGKTKSPGGRRAEGKCLSASPGSRQRPSKDKPPAMRPSRLAAQSSCSHLAHVWSSIFPWRRRAAIRVISERL